MASSSPACPDAQDDAPRRRPYEYQRNLGSDMTLMFFVTTDSDMPAKCPLRDRQLIRGLDGEATARVMFPKPPWLTEDQRYRSLLRIAEADDDDFSQGFFSLNMSLFNKEIVASEWQGRYFIMQGRVHPYILTWDLDEGLYREPVEEPIEYRAPALIVRDLGFQASVRACSLEGCCHTSH